MRYQWSVADNHERCRRCPRLPRSESGPLPTARVTWLDPPSSGIEPDERKRHDEDGHADEGKAPWREREPTETQPQHA